jgi:uncharacterized membrane protein YccC
VDAVQTLDQDRCPPILANALQRLLTNFVDTRTDFSSIRNDLHEPPVLQAMNDTLVAMADQMVRLALNMARNRTTYAEPLARASMEMIQRALQESSNGQYGPEKRNALLVLQQVYERFCRAQAMLNELAQHTSNRDSFSNALASGRPTSAFLSPLIAPERWHLGLYLGSLRLSAPSFRHALRVTVAVLLAMFLSYAMAQTFQDDALKAIGTHGYWVVLTVIVVMKPGFALTHQRNGWRLGGTLIGCGIAVVLFHLIHDTALYLAVLFLFGVLGYAFIQVNYLVSALCNTVLVLTAFHLLSPSGDVVVGARFVDTLLGCAVALLCSYILPTWEVRFLPGLANELKAANIRLLKAAIALIGAPQNATDQARKSWGAAEQAVYVALSRFSASFYRMMNEPMRHQQQAVTFNHLMIQNHVLAMQVMHVVSTVESRPAAANEIKRALLEAKKLLESQDVPVVSNNKSYSMSEPHWVSDSVVPSMALQQLIDAAEAIRRDMVRSGAA